MPGKNIIVIGSGAGGAAAAKELQGPFNVTILEEGSQFKRFIKNTGTITPLRKTGLLFDERLISIAIPSMKIEKIRLKCADGFFINRGMKELIHVRGKCTGGSTVISTGSAVMAGAEFEKIGVGLDREFEELNSLIPFYKSNEIKWNNTTKNLFEVFNELGLKPVITKKMGNAASCVSCGQCVLGCKYGAKWDAREFISEAIAGGAKLLTGYRAIKIIADDTGKKAAGVLAVNYLGKKIFLKADIIIIAAGGLGTPKILLNSGFTLRQGFFVEPVLCFAAVKKQAFANEQIPMPFISQMDGYIVSPYFDWLSFFFNRDWFVSANEIISIMIKLADSSGGKMTKKGKFLKRYVMEKTMYPADMTFLKEGKEVALKILKKMQIAQDDVFAGTVNAGHPGGTFPLYENESQSLHPKELFENLYISDATLFPASVGNPQILTIMALSIKIARKIKDKYLS